MQPGTQLGRYEILSAIGKGGMGEVWKARDTKLGREVAIKTLPPEFAEDPDRLARFEREAKLLASLNHSNIAAIYGLEEDEGSRFLVLELVEGDTLAERIGRGALPLDEALHLARQIGEALGAAHEKGVVHRDLKPANIKITDDGQVKVLDFGLAKAFAGEEADVNLSNSPTLSMEATRHGVILGTPAYMAPEQARGRPVDKRADIWAFGAVLFEMVTARPAFQGEDLTEIMASVVKIEPDFTAVPAQLRRLLTKCLQKDPKSRLRDIGDAWDYLDQSPAAVTANGSGSLRDGVFKVMAGMAVVSLVAAIILGIALFRSPETAPGDRPLVRLDVDLGADIFLEVNEDLPLALSPDGTRLAYTASVRGGPKRLYTRRLDEVEATELAGTDGAFRPFFAPDGQRLGFQVGNTLRTVPVEGGAVLTVAQDLESRAHGYWGEDGSIVIADSERLMRVPDTGGEPTVLTSRADRDFGFATPQVLPGGDVLFTVVPVIATGSQTNRAEVFSVDDGERTVVLEGATNARYLPTGHLLYQTNGTAYVTAFDLETLEIRGNPVPLIEEISYAAGSGVSRIAVADSGTIVFHRGWSGATNQVSVAWLDQDGNLEPIIDTPGEYYELSLSPDAGRIAFHDGRRVGVYDLERQTTTQLTSEPALYVVPHWTPDGNHVLFSALGLEGFGTYWARADGAGEPQLLRREDGPEICSHVAPDGERVICNSWSRGGLFTAALEFDGESLTVGEPEPFVISRFSRGYARFSPDGNWVSYISDETGRTEVIIREFPPPATGAAAEIAISSDGGGWAAWSPTTNELYYRQGFAGRTDSSVMVVGYRVEDGRFIADRPRVWAENVPALFWDIAPDGRALVTVLAEEDAGDDNHHVVFIQNFLDEVERRVTVN